MDMMEKIQETRIDRYKATDFIRRLKCLRPLDLDDKMTFETAEIHDFDDDCVIVSWSWDPSQYESEPEYNCFIDGSDSPSKVRDSVWRRTAAYMQNQEVDYLWIDRECITQDDDEEKEEAMREMDLLYHHGSHPLGILTRPVENEDELYLLAEILRGEMLDSELSESTSEASSDSGLSGRTSEASLDSELSRSVSEVSFDSELSGSTSTASIDSELSENAGEFFLVEGEEVIERAWEGIQLLREITSDTWWTRAWIYQEQYRGGKDMDLLMPHDTELEGLKLEHQDLFGNLEGELVIGSVQFSKALTALCLAFIRSAPSVDQREAADELLSTAGRYSLLLGRGSSMSPRVIADVRNRGVSRYPDRIPIIANCCSYNVRLDKNALVKEGCSHSLAILVSFLLNGEIFHFEPDETPEEEVAPSDLTVIEFIQRYAFNRFSPPFDRFELTFNRSCRFYEVCLEADGVHTEGHLWKLCTEPIEIQSQQFRDRILVKKTLWCLHDFIANSEYVKGLDRRGQLASKLERFLRSSPDSPAKKYMWKMAKALVYALDEGLTLRLGYLCQSPMNSGWSPPTAIFICPDQPPTIDHPAYVFTSFRERKVSGGPGYICDVDKHVSLQVSAKNTGGLPELKAQEWIHGLWFWSMPPREVVFPLPRVLSEA